MQKVIYVVGPTGVGKTALAFSLARKFDGELVSADSVQVYKNLDIISGKDISKDSTISHLPQLKVNGITPNIITDSGINISLLDVVDPSFSFTVSHFQALASQMIDYIFSENKTPIVVGGTGLYVKALLEGIDTNSIEPDLELRNDLEGCEISELQTKLREVNPARLASMNESDVKNKRRLIRAIEISSQKTVDTSQESRGKNRYENLVIGLYCDKDVLKKRIDDRVDERLKQGAMDEAALLFANYESLSEQVKNANGYKQLFSYLLGETEYDISIYRWKISEYRHAKNQMTWFRKYGNVEWFDIGEVAFEKKIEERIANFL